MFLFLEFLLSDSLPFLKHKHGSSWETVACQPRFLLHFEAPFEDLVGRTHLASPSPR